MAQLTVPTAPKEYATHYEMLLGVDFQADQTEVDRRRSPDMFNMISDFGGNPVKRDGYRRVDSAYASLVMVGGKMYGVKIASSMLKIYIVTLDGYEFSTDVSTTYTLAKDIGTINCVFVYQEKIYIVATKCLVAFDTIDHTFKYVGIGANMMSAGTLGESAPVMEDNVPLTVIGLKPDGTAGTAYKDKNLFSIYQQVSYQGDGSTTQFKIPTYKKIGTYIKAEVKDENGDWQSATASVGTTEEVTGKSIDGTSWITNNIVDPTVTFSSAPSAPVVAGEDNVRITFCPYSMDELETGKYKGYYNETLVNLLKSKAATFQDSRMFIADTYKVYYSDVNNPFMISDLSWFDVESEVMCFTKSSSHLAIITLDNGGNTIFLADEATRTVDSTTGETETYFTVKASNSGIGAISTKSISTLNDEPLFLSATGIYGILTNFTSEKYTVNRSSRINRKLCKEANLENAVGIAFNEYYYLAINGKMYVLDGRHKESDRAGNKPLEAYYFTGMPTIKDMFVVGERMYFTDATYTYAWNDDLEDTDRYYDGHKKKIVFVQYQIGDDYVTPPTGEWVNVKPTPEEGEVLWYKGTYDDGSYDITTYEISIGDAKMTGDPVHARWSSVFDDDGAPQKLKTLMKKGSMVTLVPHSKSGCEITLYKDGDRKEYLGSFDSDMQSFEYIDFARFTFSSNDVAFDEFTRKKMKKYKRLQIQVENKKAEPFGLTQITKTYTFGNYAKR